MSRKDFGPKDYIYPMPVWVIGTYNKDNIPDATPVSYAGVINNETVQISLQKNNEAISNIKLNKAFTINLATVETINLVNYLGSVSFIQNPNKVKCKRMSIFRSMIVDAPILEDFPICLECLVDEIFEARDTILIIGKILNTSAVKEVLNENNQIDVKKLHAITFDPVTQNYIELGNVVGASYIWDDIVTVEDVNPLIFSENN